MIAKINTKSNYRNLNGKWLEVAEIRGTRVSCIVKDEEAKDGQIICEGYLKTISYKDAWANVWGNLSESNKKEFTGLANFDSAKFEEITGIKV